VPRQPGDQSRVRRCFRQEKVQQSYKGLHGVTHHS
jgi:hypothetical protein